MPSVQSGDLVLKLSCKNMVSSCWKSSKSCETCYCVLPAQGQKQLHVSSLYKMKRRSRLRGLGGIFILLARLPVTGAVRVIHSSAEFSACGSKLWCRIAAG